ncbi:Serine/threonine-protein phosphatase 2A 56 kDa regulatory subunitdelta isoform [Zostera marina]|uniref:Serine/threonine protein phosphatase 2A regulatory subunit n=1 Tax=Zostera marina TaxID=29655 RepID=A0A0K9Q032_ZOSMR|nr:Serine/threonine-protein phosphatase 2A 56 kDa regulatory subunitdelta isoform [Zostera marina]
MFHKIIKRGSRKTPKSEPSDPIPSFSSRVVRLSTTSSVTPAGTDTSSSNSVNLSNPLPSFRDGPVSDLENMFIRKLKICSMSFDFADPRKFPREKEVKRQVLLELVEFVKSRTEKIADHLQEEMVKMISSNIFRSFPPLSHEITGGYGELMEIGAEEEVDDSCHDPAWAHLGLIYELLLAYIVSSKTDANVAKNYINHSFVMGLLDLLNSEDQRERECLKKCLHGIYGRFMIHRPSIRSSINNIFYRLILDSERYYGIGELLDIIGSIINGFTLPMKEEHRLFLVRVLIPLHKPKFWSVYQTQLSYCVVLFVEKDTKLAHTVITSLLRYWPLTNCQKELFFLEELEDVLELTQLVEFQKCLTPLFKQIAKCLNSSHFQISERTLYFWNNDHIVGMIAQNCQAILPIIFEALEMNIQCHWNQAIRGLTVNVQKMFIDMDSQLFQECQKNYSEKIKNAKKNEHNKQMIWKMLEDLGTSNAN